MGTFQPREFAAPSGAARALVDAVPLATLVIGDLSAVQLPLLCPDPPGVDPTVMLGHVAAAGPFADVTSTDALAIHLGVDGYVSPSWYATTREHGRVVPTWDYQSVHLRGTLHLSGDDDQIMRVITALTERHERGRDAPWAVTDAPATYIARQRRNILAVRLDVHEIVVTHKLSQNRSAEDVAGVVAGLRADGGRAAEDVADAVEHASFPR
ncbi:MAG: transcriptional regulator [Nitriliruptoraceae bacterium]|jgi:transcriptional regulator